MIKRFLLSFLLLTAAVRAEEAAEDVSPLDVQPLTPSVQEFYGYMQDALESGEWWSAIDYGGLVLYNYPDSPFSQEIPYFLGQAYYNLDQYELANETLSDYLKKSTSPKHFEEAIEMKFTIAESFRLGKKIRPFGKCKFIPIMPAHEEAIKIYDEVIATLPHHEIAAKSLLGKAKEQAYLEDFKPSIETLQTLIRRFPKNDLAAEAYLEINRIFLAQYQTQHLDPDLLDLAEVNLRKFRLAFPRETRIAEAEHSLKDMREISARHLFEIGEFFQRRKQNDASLIYYSKVITKFPETQCAEEARLKRDALEIKKQKL